MLKLHDVRVDYSCQLSSTQIILNARCDLGDHVTGVVTDDGTTQNFVGSLPNVNLDKTFVGAFADKTVDVGERSDVSLMRNTVLLELVFVSTSCNNLLGSIHGPNQQLRNHRR